MLVRQDPVAGFAPDLFAGRLEIGCDRALHVREERLTTRADACRLLYVSDIHLRRGRSENLSWQVLESAARTAPHAVLLGGDLADRASELPALADLVRRLRAVAPLFAVGGNHDVTVGLDDVREAVVRGGGSWIHHAPAQFAHGTRRIDISGPHRADETAATATGHVARGRADVRVLCAHNPRVWKRAKRAGFDLVLAGHLHGCQLVAFTYRDRLFPGTLFYPYCVLSHQSGSSRLVISRGVSDLVPVRWNCPREVVLCHV